MKKVSKQIQVFRKVDGFINEAQKDELMTAIEGTVTEHVEQYAIADQTEKHPYKEIEEIREEMVWSGDGSILKIGESEYELKETATIHTHRTDNIEGATEETTKIECFYLLEMP